MKTLKLAAALLGTSLMACSSPRIMAPAMSAQPASVAVEKEIVFESHAGSNVKAYQGHLFVPENRSKAESRKIKLEYVRFPATTNKPSAPIIYLAGGPGGSGIGTAKGDRFNLFMAMRAFGDVIAFDQRGTGASNTLPTCNSTQIDRNTTNTSDAEYDVLFQNALRECLDFWTNEGVDIHGYNTRESVSDLDALREHLGAKKISLWGISYGSHLSLAAVKQMEGKLEKVVIASGEGLDQTIKLPAQTDAYFSRLQEAVNQQPATKAALPDIAAMMRRVHAKLDASPLMLEIPAGEGKVREYLWQRRDMQETASSLISDPVPASLLLQIYAALDQDDISVLLSVAPHLTSDNENLRLRPMSTLMDIASGTSTERRKRIETQAQTSLLSTYLNQSVTLEDVDPSLVMDENFRKNPVSHVPLLLLSGTLDGRTYVESQQGAISAMPNAQSVIVRNAGHNLFMTSPEVTETIEAFMRGENVDGREITVELPDFMTAGYDLLK